MSIVRLLIGMVPVTLLALAFFALLFVSSGCGLVSRLGRMLLRVAGLGLLDWLFCSALLRWRGLTLPTL